MKLKQTIMNTKESMLNEMFKCTSYEKNIKFYSRNIKSSIETVYLYFTQHPNDPKRVRFCATLLS